MNIVCYGDSNTYGFNPLDGGRYETNWVDIVRENYKDDFVVNAGLNGRLAEPRQFLYDITLRQYAPIGLLIIMLGTNNVDHLEPIDHITVGLHVMLRRALSKAENILLLAPPYLRNDEERYQRSKELNKKLKVLADSFHADFIDVEDVITELSFDGIHLTQKGHEQLGKTIVDYMKKSL
ncbi:MAG: GDSL-type esterase/lipase family protein [Catenibacterium mitsuokai]|nr:GDSL-type esterase/lipase family protein [Catenibacterium mitsuokai]MEE0334699.1 GDSL-type esterase/lipase family protein [Catenibacterium mitsuokai]